MRSPARIFGLFAVALLLLSSAESKADLIYSVGISGPTNVAPGQNFNVTIFLQEIVTGASTPILGDPSLGIAQGNFTVNRTAGTSIDILGVTLNPNFDFGNGGTFSNNFASGTQGTFTPVFGTETSLGSGIYRLTLATISMTANSLGVTTFSSADFLSGADDLVLYDPNLDPLVLDDVISDPIGNNGISGGGYGDITITSAPEPTTMGTLGAFGAIGAAASYLRRRKKKVLSPKTV